MRVCARTRKNLHSIITHTTQHPPRYKAAADALRLPVRLLTSYRDAAVITVDPAAAAGAPPCEVSPSKDRASKGRMLYLAFWAEVHYSSLCAAADL